MACNVHIILTAHTMRPASVTSAAAGSASGLSELEPAPISPLPASEERKGKPGITTDDFFFQFARRETNVCVFLTNNVKVSEIVNIVFIYQLLVINYSILFIHPLK